MFKRPERGKNVSVAFRIFFRILFRVFQTVFRIDFKLRSFSGEISFCRHAALSYYAPLIYYAVNPSLRGEMPVKPKEMMSAQWGRDSKSLCDRKFTTRSKFTIE